MNLFSAKGNTEQYNRFHEEAIVSHRIEADPIAGPSTSARSNALAVRLDSPPSQLRQREVMNPEAEASAPNNSKGKGKRRMVDDVPDALPTVTEPVRPAKRGRPAKQDARPSPGGARSGEKEAATKRTKQRKAADSSLPKRKPPRAPTAITPRPDNEAPPAVEEEPKCVPAKPVEYTPVQVYDPTPTIPTNTILTTTFNWPGDRSTPIVGGHGESIGKCIFFSIAAM
ncbi:hypothetical protein BJ912DRAFT_177472 [Pholiota molesta]|nr:hypothetical protein BJ912DRAFT_177472 [Pholiota molesta]